MPDTVTWTIDEGVAVVELDDGKANALTHEVFDALEAAMTEAETSARALVIAGRPGRFSGGFDLATMTAGPDESMPLLKRGAQLATRLYGFRIPVVMACTGHAVAMGAILLMSADLRIGASGPYKIGLNEVSIGMPVPRFALAFARDRLAPATMPQAVMLARLFDPEAAIGAGFLDEVTAPDEVVGHAVTRATELAGSLQDGAFRITRELLRSEVLDGLDAALAQDLGDFT